VNSVDSNPSTVAPRRVHSAPEMYPWTLRQGIRSLVIDVLANYQSFQQTFQKGDETTCRVDILLLHTVFPDEEANFRQLLASLSKSYTFVGYMEAVTLINSGQIDGRYLAFSFDDGMKCCLSAAAILEEFNARACFFVCPDIIGETSEEKIEEFCRGNLLHDCVEFMDWDDLEHLRSAGHEIGGHTMGHVDLATLEPRQIRENLAECHAILKQRLGSCDHFAWPFGRFSNMTAAAVQSVFDVGFCSCASGERGTHGVVPYEAVPRYPILRRQSMEANWPKSHIDFFLNRRTQRPCPWSEMI